MSRIGRMPIEIPAGVTVTYDNHHMNVKALKVNYLAICIQI